MDLLAIFNLAALSLSLLLSLHEHTRRHLKCVSDSPAITACCIRLLFMRRSAIHRHLHSLPQCHAVIESLHILTSTHSLSDDISGLEATFPPQTDGRLTCMFCGKKKKNAQGNESRLGDSSVDAIFNMHSVYAMPIKAERSIIWMKMTLSLME